MPWLRGDKAKGGEQGPGCLGGGSVPTPVDIIPTHSGLFNGPQCHAQLILCLLQWPLSLQSFSSALLTLRSPKVPCLLLFRARKPPPHPASLSPSLSTPGPASRCQVQWTRSPNLCLSQVSVCFSPESAPHPFGHCLLLSVSPVFAFLVCPSPQNLNQCKFLHNANQHKEKNKNKSLSIPFQPSFKLYMYAHAYVCAHIYT